jgi:hypothetical protein
MHADLIAKVHVAIAAASQPAQIFPMLMTVSVSVRT